MFSYYHDDFDDDHYYDDYDYDYGCEYADDECSYYYCSLPTPAISRGSASKKKCRSGTAALALILTH